MSRSRLLFHLRLLTVACISAAMTADGDRTSELAEKQMRYRRTFDKSQKHYLSGIEKEREIRYFFDKSLDSMDEADRNEAKNSIRKGFKMWGDRTCLKMKEISSQEGNLNFKQAGNVLMVYAGGRPGKQGYGCEGAPWYLAADSQVIKGPSINIAACDFVYYGVIVATHEIGHALGLPHLMSHPDRDKWMKMRKGARGEYGTVHKWSDRYSFGVPFPPSYRSIMQLDYTPFAYNLPKVPSGTVAYPLTPQLSKLSGYRYIEMTMCPTVHPFSLFYIGRTKDFPGNELALINKRYCTRECVADTSKDLSGFPLMHSEDAIPRSGNGLVCAPWLKYKDRNGKNPFSVKDKRSSDCKVVPGEERKGPSCLTKVGKVKPGEPKFRLDSCYPSCGHLAKQAAKEGKVRKSRAPLKTYQREFCDGYCANSGYFAKLDWPDGRNLTPEQQAGKDPKCKCSCPPDTGGDQCERQKGGDLSTYYDLYGKGKNWFYYKLHDGPVTVKAEDMKMEINRQINENPGYESVRRKGKVSPKDTFPRLWRDGAYDFKENGATFRQYGVKHIQLGWVFEAEKGSRVQLSFDKANIKMHSDHCGEESLIVSRGWCAGERNEVDMLCGTVGNREVQKMKKLESGIHYFVVMLRMRKSTYDKGFELTMTARAVSGRRRRHHHGTSKA